MEELSYSFHIGSDKNKKNSVRLTSKNNISGTNSMSNRLLRKIWVKPINCSFLFSVLGYSL